QSEFASDRSLVGPTISIQAKPFTVAGITPPGFFGDRVSDTPPDFWLPLATELYVYGENSILHHADSNWLYAFGRVREGSSIGLLQDKLSTALRQWLATRPAYTENGGAAEIPKQHVMISPAGGGIQNLQQETGKGLKMLMILSSVVLLIACANIANLLLARATMRGSEVAMRTALGASRARVIREVLTETTVLSCIGGAAGLIVAYLGSHVILRLAFPDATSLPVDASPSIVVLGFTFLVSLATGSLLGTAPVWLSFNAQPAQALHGVRSVTRDRSSLPQRALVVLQAALSMVLLAGAIPMSKSLGNLEKQKFGIA